MPSEDADLLREALATHNLREFAQYLHPDAVLYQAPEIPDSGTYRGKDEFLRGLRLWLEEWDEFRYVPVEIEETACGLFVRLRLLGRGKGSGVEIEQQIFHFWQFRDGLLSRCEVYWSEDQARRAAGL